MDFTAVLAQARQPGVSIFFTSKRDKRKVTHDGFIYTVGKESTNTLYYCEFRRNAKCPGALVVGEDNSTALKRLHNHERNYSRVEAQLRKVKCLDQDFKM